MSRWTRVLAIGLLGAALGGRAVLAQNIPKPEPPPPGFAATPSVPKGVASWGTTQLAYYRMAASDFTAMSTPGAHFANDDLDGYGDIHSQDDSQFGRWGVIGGSLVGSPHLPSGAKLMYLELDSCDGDNDLNVLLALHSCDYLGKCLPGVPTLSSVNNEDVGCSFTSADISAFDIVVNNLYGQISIEVELQSDGADPNFRGVIIGYLLQVAPPPAFATFADVPTTDFGFQYIQALVAAGITGGTGGGNYSPDAPVTRRQMAIFLAKALGIYSLGF